MTDITRFPFKHKNWYYWLAFLANVGVSGILCFFWKFSSVSQMKYVSVALITFFLIGLIIYSARTLREYKSCVSTFRYSHNYISKFLIGISTSFIAINIGFIACAIAIIKPIDTKWYILVCAVFSGLLGVISNVFINWFELKIQFEFFYRKYKDTVVEDVIKATTERKRQIKEKYNNQPKYNNY